MDYTFKEIKHLGHFSDPVGGTSTRECEHTFFEEEDQAFNSVSDNKIHKATCYSLAGVEGKQIDIGSASIHNYSSEINTSKENIHNTAESEDNISASSIVRDFSYKRLFDALNPSALEKEPAAVSKNIIVVKHPQPALIICEYMRLIIIGEYMQLVWQERHIFPDCQINAALMGTKSCIFCTDCFVTYEIPLSFIPALFRSRCRLKASLLNTLKILSLFQLSQESLAIDANICCVFCAKQVPVKNARDLKQGQHLTRPGQSPLGFFFYRHHLFLKDFVIFPDGTVMLTLIHYTKCGRQIDVYETVEPYVPGDNLNVVQYDNPKYPPEAIIDRAESSVNFRRKAKLDSYSVPCNNCESVITEFMVGSKISLQALSYFQIIANILMFLFCIASWFTPWDIRMFTFVAFFIYFILFSYLDMNLSAYYNKDKIICESCWKYIRKKIFCWVTFWTLIIFYFPEM